MEVGELSVNQEEVVEVDDWVIDGLTREELDVQKVAAARKEEVDFMSTLGVFETSSWEECLRMTGKAPITTRWIDADKGSDGNVVVRSRLAARDFKKKGEADRVELFAATPALEAKRMLFRMAVLKNQEHPCMKYELMFLDVKKAHLNGKLQENE